MAKICGKTHIVLLLALYNFIWMCIGSFGIYLGVQALQFNDESIKKLVLTNFESGAIILVMLGSAGVMTAAVGFFGACCESSRLLYIYGFNLLILLAINSACLYYSHKYEQGDYEEKLFDGISNGIKNFKSDPKLAYGVQKIQTLMQCCGWEGPGDYGNIFTGDVPSSCCKDTSYSIEDPLKTCLRIRVSYTDGCKDSPVIRTLTRNIAYTAYALILIHLIVILSAWLLARHLKAHKGPFSNVVSKKSANQNPPFP